jgi:hypothetical protein
MTEAEWRACTDPQRMLEFLRGKGSERKLRLFTWVCCQRLWQLLVDERSRHAVQVLGRYLDGLSSRAELARANEAAPCPGPACPVLGSDSDYLYEAAGAAFCASLLDNDPVDSAADVSSYTFGALAHLTKTTGKEDPLQSQHLRDIVGNPFRPRPPKRGKRRWEEKLRGWLTRQGGTVPKLAQAIYEDWQLLSVQLDNQRLAVLADALEDAGCDDTDILSHCRSDGSHVRGCWVVDLLLGKE